ncbi:MAG TPA: hypothetical protein VIV63_04330 [Steroidobacteraceae bacterium]
MKRTHLLAISAVLSAVAIGTAYLFGTDEAPAQRAVPESRIGVARSPDTVVTETVASTDEKRDAGEARVRQIALGIERALVARDLKQRETAFAFLLPELIELQPDRVIALVARQEPGETRDALREEVVRQWIVRDRNAAIEWMGTLEDEAERKASATLAMRTLATTAPAEAIEVADQFGVGRDDGSLEHMVQIWATEKPEEAMRWIDSQPAADPRTAQLRARIERVRAQFAAGTYDTGGPNRTPSDLSDDM